MKHENMIVQLEDLQECIRLERTVATPVDRGKKPQTVFMVRLTYKDGSAHVYDFVSLEQADKFFAELWKTLNPTLPAKPSPRASA